MQPENQPVTVEVPNTTPTVTPTPATTIQYVETKSSNKVLYIILGILALLACCVLIVLVNLISVRNGGNAIINVPLLNQITGGQVSPKQALQNVMDANNVAELAKKNSTYGSSKVDLSIQMSQGSMVISGTGTNQSDLLNKLMQSDMKLTGKLNMGVINFDFGDGVDVSYISKMGTTSQDTEAYVKYSFSDSLKNSLSSLGAGSIVSVAPDKYIKMSLTSSANAEDLKKGTEMLQKAGDIFKRVLLDYGSYATVTQSQNGDITLYSFKIDSAKFSTRLMQEKSAILAITNTDTVGSNSAQNEKSFNDIVSAVKYLNFDKMNIGIRSNYIASEDISVSMTKDGLNYLKSLSGDMTSSAQTTFDITGFNMNVNSTTNYSDNKSSIVVPTDFYTGDQWNQKLGQGQNSVYEYQTSTSLDTNNNSMKYFTNLKEGESCGTDGGTYFKMCAEGLSCDLGYNAVLTGNGYTGTCSSTCSGKTASGYTRCW